MPQFRGTLFLFSAQLAKRSGQENIGCSIFQRTKDITKNVILNFLLLLK